MKTHMSKGTVTIILSDAARRAALLAGQPAEREQTYEIKTTKDIAAALDAGASITEAGKCHLPWPRDDYYWIDFAPVRPTTTIEAIAANAVARAGLAAKKAKAAAKAKANDAAQTAEERAGMKTRPRLDIEISIDNATFDDGMATELARILRQLAQDIESGKLLDSLKLYDINGNRVGGAHFID